MAVTAGIVCRKDGFGCTVVDHSCTEKIVWQAGNAYYHAAGEHSTHPDHKGPQLARNEGSEPVEITVIFPNVPHGQPTEGLLVPRDFEPAPAECPTLD